MMKKLLSFVLAFTIALSSQAQIAGASFEVWTVDTATFGFPPVLPDETFTFNTPENWTTSNQISAAPSLGGREFVTRDTVAADGSFSAKLRTDSLTIQAVGISATIPGILINGKFDIDIQSLILGGGSFDPSSIPDAGTAFTERAEKIVGYFNYAPNGTDECSILAALVSGTDIVGQAQFTSGSATNGYQWFEAEFEYNSCAMPDRLVFVVTSSPLDVTGGSGSPGSILWVDSLGVHVPGAAITVGPFAEDDAATTDKNEAVTFELLTNDEACDGANLETPTITTGPVNGTLVVNADNSVTYTPDTDYVGSDSFTYEVCDDAGECDEAEGSVNVQDDTNVGIEDLDIASVSVFPNPANAQLNVETQINGMIKIEVFAHNGAQIEKLEINQPAVQLDLSDYQNGAYIIRVTEISTGASLNQTFSVIR